MARPNGWGRTTRPKSSRTQYFTVVTTIPLNINTDYRNKKKNASHPHHCKTDDYVNWNASRTLQHVFTILTIACIVILHITNNRNTFFIKFSTFFLPCQAQPKDANLAIMVKSPVPSSFVDLKWGTYQIKSISLEDQDWGSGQEILRELCLMTESFTEEREISRERLAIVQLPHAKPKQEASQHCGPATQREKQPQAISSQWVTI